MIVGRALAISSDLFSNGALVIFRIYTMFREVTPTIPWQEDQI
jgi:hypothetical protein